MAYTKNQYTNKIKSANVAADTGEQASKDAKISWEGDTLDTLRSFPQEPRKQLGVYLRLVQTGEKPPDSTPVPGLDDVFELRDQDKRAWYRILYLKKIQNTVYVLHCFEKQSGRIEKKDIRTAQSRLKEVKRRLAKGERDERRGAKKAARNDR